MITACNTQDDIELYSVYLIFGASENWKYGQLKIGKIGRGQQNWWDDKRFGKLIKKLGIENHGLNYYRVILN